MTPEEQIEKLRRAVGANPTDYNVANGLTPEQEMQQRYRNVFGTAEGRIVLGDISTIGHVFDAIDPTDIARNAERNFALVVLQSAGAFDQLYPQLGLGLRREQ